MQFIKFLSTPKIKFAHKYSTKSYDFSFKKKDNIVEITYFAKGNVYFESLQNKSFYHENFIRVEKYDADCHFYSFGQHEHYTMAIDAIYEIKDSYEPGSIPLTPYISDKYYVSKIGEKIKQIIRLKQTGGNDCLEIAAVFELLSLFEYYYKFNEKYSDDPTKGYKYFKYGKKVEDYIASNIDQPICVEDIANKLNLSCGYLSKVFKEYSGKTIVEYANIKKLETILEIVKTKKCSLYVASQQLNFNDPNYVSLMFKKYFRKTFREMLEQ